MEIFNEVYGLYYEIVEEILKEQQSFTIEQLRERIEEKGFGETALNLLPVLTEEKEWHLLRKGNTNEWQSIFKNLPNRPQTTLEKAWLKMILKDERIHLFLPQNQLKELEKELEAVPNLLDSTHIQSFDQFNHTDPYDDPVYQKHFQSLLKSMQEKKLVSICYQASAEKEMNETLYAPLKLEYSQKNHKFRVKAWKYMRKDNWRFVTLNIDKIQAIQVEEERQPSFNKPNKNEKEIKCLIHDERNALDRALLHFSDYKKETKKTADNKYYEMTIRYLAQNETELLIQILSFGPLITVTSPQNFIELLRARLKKQLQLDNLLEE